MIHLVRSNKNNEFRIPNIKKITIKIKKKILKSNSIDVMSTKSVKHFNLTV